MTRRKLAVSPVANTNPSLDQIDGALIPAMEIDDQTGVIYVGGRPLAGSGGGPNWLSPQALVGTVDGNNTVFTLPSTPNPNFIVTVGGLLFGMGIDYTYDADTQTITFAQAPTVTPVAYW